MFVKFFSRPKTKAKSNNAIATRGGSPHQSMDYLLKKHEDEIRVLAGNPQISVQLAESLDFQNKYTVGCLTFEETNIPENHKYEIMQKFEDTFFAGLSKDQYDISWIEHTDKGRLELNFFIPNVELDTGKRLQPYYDRADRHLAENFKQTINLQYGLSSPNDPQKHQTLTMNRNIPKNTKDAVQALNGLIEDAYEDGKIKNRSDVIHLFEKHGFEIARKTEKYISIKNENGRNIRLKGAFYEQDFGIGGESQTKGRSRGFGNARSHQECLEEARARLTQSTQKRLSDNQRYSRARKTKSHQQVMEDIHHSSLLSRGSDGFDSNRNDLFRQSGQQRQTGSSGMEAISRALQSPEQEYQVRNLYDERQDEQDLRAGRPSISRPIMGRQLQSSDSKGGLDEPNYTAIAESLERLKRAAQAELECRRAEAQRAIQATQRAIEQTRTRERGIKELARKILRRIEMKLQQRIERKRELERQKASISLTRGRGMGM